LEAHPDYSVSIVGYADKDTGTSVGNMRLSERRAENVKKQLVANGVAEGRIIMNYKGDTVQPYDKVLNRVVICTLE
jgi:outer membrane protein OmpA-like peptidoglycan-associated protein